MVLDFIEENWFFPLSRSFHNPDLNRTGSSVHNFQCAMVTFSTLEDLNPEDLSRLVPVFNTELIAWFLCHNIFMA